MKALLKVLLGLVGFAIVLAVAAVVAVASLDPNEHKDWITAKVQEKTGRTLSIDGKIGLEFYPWLGLEADGVTLGNAPGFGPEPFLKLAHVKARIKLLPLLREQYEIDTVQLHGVNLSLARNKDGVTNWADLASGEPAEAKPLPLTAIVLGGVDIQKAQISWSDAATGARYVVKDLTATTGPLTYGDPISLALSLTGSGNRPAVDGDMKLDGMVAYDLDAGKYSVRPLELKGTLRGKNVPGGQMPLSLSAAAEVDLGKETAAVSDLKLNILQTSVAGSVEAANIKSPKPQVKANLDVQGADLALLFKVAEIEPLATDLSRIAERKFDLQARLDADLERGDLDVPEFSANLLGATVKGEIRATNTQSESPAVKGAIDASGPDLPNLLQVAGQVQGGAKSPLARYGRQLAKAPDRSFSVKTTFEADLKRGSVDVPALAVKVAGATLDGRIRAGNVQSDTPSFQGALNAAGPDLPVLMLAAGSGEGKESPLVANGRRLAAMKDKSFIVKTEFDADLKKGNIDLPTLSAQAFGVEVNGRLKATDMESSGGSVAGQLTVKGEKLADLLGALEQAELGQVLRSVNFDAVIGGTRADLSLKPMALKAVVASPEIKGSPVTIALNADTRLNLDKQALQLDDFTLKGLGLNVEGSVKAEKILEAPEFDGQVSIGEFNPRQLMLQLKQKPPKTADPEAFRKVAANATFSGSQTGFSVRHLALKMDETNLKGELAVAEFEKPVVRYLLDIDQIDADRYLPPKPQADRPQQKQAAKPSAPAPAAEAPAAVPVEFLRGLDVDGRTTIGKLKINGLRLSKVTTVLKGKGGLVKLDPVTADLYQGTHAGNLAIDVTKDLPKLTVNTKLLGVQVEPLLIDMNGESRLKGTGNFSAALVAAGRTTDDFKKTLNGQMSLVLKNGAIKGYNLGKIMRQGKSLKESFSLSVSDKEQTDLSDITGNPVAQNGVIRLDDLAGKSPGMRLSGKGVLADLPRNLIDYKVTATLVATSKGQGGADLEEGKLEGIPLDCTLKGSLDAPKRDCDASKLLAALGVKLLQGVLGAPAELVPGTTDATGALGGAAAAVGAAGAAAAGALGGLFGGGDKDKDKSGTTQEPATAPAPKSTTTSPTTTTAPTSTTTTTTAPKSTTTTTTTPKSTTTPTTTTTPKSAPTTTTPKSTTTEPKTTTTTAPKTTTTTTTAPKSTTTPTTTTTPKSTTTTTTPKSTTTEPKSATTATLKDTTTTAPKSTTTTATATAATSAPAGTRTTTTTVKGKKKRKVTEATTETTAEPVAATTEPTAATAQTAEETAAQDAPQ
ncbi:MAG: AsmA family protein [Gammaproteobacteria bacterium]|nr:AsmA family protein [Gammaproteobacteria bacterium]